MISNDLRVLDMRTPGAPVGLGGGLKCTQHYQPTYGLML